MTTNKCLSKLSAGWVALLLTYLLEECPLADTSVPRSSLFTTSLNHQRLYYSPTLWHLLKCLWNRLDKWSLSALCDTVAYYHTQIRNQSIKVYDLIWLRNHGHMAVIGYGKYLILPFFGTIGQYIRFIWSRSTTSRQNMNRALQTRLIRYLPYPISAKWP